MEPGIVKTYIFRGCIGLITYITFVFLNGLVFYLYTTYVTNNISRSVSNVFGLIYIFGVFSVPCLLMPLIKEHKKTRTILMLLPPALLALLGASSNPKRVFGFVALSIFSYLMILVLEKVGEKIFPFTRVELKHSTDAGYGIALYLFLSWMALFAYLLP